MGEDLVRTTEMLLAVLLASLCDPQTSSKSILLAERSSYKVNVSLTIYGQGELLSGRQNTHALLKMPATSILFYYKQHTATDPRMQDICTATVTRGLTAENVINR